MNYDRSTRRTTIRSEGTLNANNNSTQLILGSRSDGSLSMKVNKTSTNMIFGTFGSRTTIRYIFLLKVCFCYYSSIFNPWEILWLPTEAQGILENLQCQSLRHRRSNICSSKQVRSSRTCNDLVKTRTEIRSKTGKLTTNVRDRNSDGQPYTFRRWRSVVTSVYGFVQIVPIFLLQVVRKYHRRMERKITDDEFDNIPAVATLPWVSCLMYSDLGFQSGFGTLGTRTSIQIR